MTTPLEVFDAAIISAYKEYVDATDPARFALVEAEETFQAICKPAAKKRNEKIRTAKEAYQKALPPAPIERG